MESQKIKNLLDHKDETYPKYQTEEWYINNDRNNGSYPEGNGNDKGIKIDTEVVIPFLCDYADAYVLVTGNITIENVFPVNVPNTKAVFKNCHLNHVHVEDSDDLDIIMNMYNLIEYSDNYYSDIASLYHFKRQEPLPNNTDLAIADSSSFKYNFNLLGDATAENGNSVWKNAQIIVPLKYISSIFRSFELPLINTKLYIQLNYTKNSVISTAAGDSTFKTTKTELYIPVVTLKTEENNKLNQLLLESESGDSAVSSKSKNNKFKRIVYWNE